MPTKTSKPEPPADAVARDPHWNATREKLRARQRPIAQMTICDDTTLARDLEVAKTTVRRLKANAEADPTNEVLKEAITSAQLDLQAAQAAHDAAAIVLRFQALPRPEWEALKKAHPATEEQAEDGVLVNIDTIGPELIAASSLDGITTDEASEYLDTWAEGEAATLFGTAWDVQGQIRLDVGKG